MGVWGMFFGGVCFILGLGLGLWVVGGVHLDWERGFNDVMSALAAVYLEGGWETWSIIGKTGGLRKSVISRGREFCFLKSQILITFFILPKGFGKGIV